MTAILVCSSILFAVFDTFRGKLLARIPISGLLVPAAAQSQCITPFRNAKVSTSIALIVIVTISPCSFTL
jgi:hypothetical protein